MNSSGVPSNIHALSGRRASISALWSGHIGARNATSPYPERNVSRSRTVIGRFAGTESSSSLSIVRRTFRFASSGRNSSTGSSSRSLQSSTRAIAATAVIGFVTEARRKIVSRRIGAARSNASVPIASACSAPRRLRSATRPGSRPLSTWRSSVSCILLSRAGANPLTRANCDYLPSRRLRCHAMFCEILRPTATPAYARTPRCRSECSASSASRS